MGQLDKYQRAAISGSGLPPPKTPNKKQAGCLVAIITVVLLLGLGALYLRQPDAPNLRRLQHILNNPSAYNDTALCLNRALIGTHYSIMHDPKAGLSVIFDMGLKDAQILSDPTTDLSKNYGFYIDTNSPTYESYTQLRDSYRIRIERHRIAAVIVNLDIISGDTLSSVLLDLHLNKNGADQKEGVWAVYGDNHQQLLHDLHKQGCIEGLIQTVNKDKSSWITVPIDKEKKMDVMYGKAN